MTDMPRPDRAPPASEFSVAESRMRAVQYREMACTATTADVRTALLALARKYERLAGREPSAGA